MIFCSILFYSILFNYTKVEEFMFIKSIWFEVPQMYEGGAIAGLFSPVKGLTGGE